MTLSVNRLIVQRTYQGHENSNFGMVVNSAIMGKPKPVAYAVLNGRDETKGIFTDWTECSQFVTGVKCSNFKGYTSYGEAKSILKNAGINPRVYEEGKWFSCTEYEKRNCLFKEVCCQ